MFLARADAPFARHCNHRERVYWRGVPVNDHLYSFLAPLRVQCIERVVATTSGANAGRQEPGDVRIYARGLRLRARRRHR